jgi:hypothetical protein
MSETNSKKQARLEELLKKPSSPVVDCPILCRRLNVLMELEDDPDLTPKQRARVVAEALTIARQMAHLKCAPCVLF